jgi:hypothetical protein
MRRSPDVQMANRRTGPRNGALEITRARLYWSENLTLTPRCRK